MDDVINQAEEAVDKIIPRTRLFLKTAGQQVAIDRGESHGKDPGLPLIYTVTARRSIASGNSPAEVTATAGAIVAVVQFFHDRAASGCRNFRRPSPHSVQ